MNDGIFKHHRSMSYESIDDVTECILALGQGSLLAEMDIKEAYRNVPVHPDDRHLLAVRWKGVVYVNKVLPFGLRSSAITSSAVTDLCSG